MSEQEKEELSAAESWDKMIEEYKKNDPTQHRQCRNCANAIIEEAIPPTYDDPGDPMGVYCSLIENAPREKRPDHLTGRMVSFSDFDWLESLFDEYYEDTAIRCDHFILQPVGECEECKEKIDAPKLTWDRHVMVPETGYTFPVCSKECQEEAERKIKEATEDAEREYRALLAERDSWIDL